MLKKIKIYLLCLFSILFIGGCVPNNYTQEELDFQLKLGTDLIENYMKNNTNNGKLTSIEVMPEIVDDNNDYGYQLTEFVKGTFIENDIMYNFCINTNNGDIYTSYKNNELIKIYEEKLKELLNATDINITNFSFNNKIISENEKINKEISIGNVLKSKEKSLISYQKINDIKNKIELDVYYKGNYELINFNPEDFSSFYKINIYHVEDEYDFNNITDFICSEKIEYSYNLGQYKYSSFAKMKLDRVTIKYIALCSTNKNEQSIDSYNVTKYNIDNVIVKQTDKILQINTFNVSSGFNYYLTINNNANNKEITTKIKKNEDVEKELKLNIIKLNNTNVISEYATPYSFEGRTNVAIYF